MLNFGLMATMVAWQPDPAAPPRMLTLWCMAGLPITTGVASYYHALTSAAPDSESHAKLFHFVSVGQLTAWGLYFLLYAATR